MFFCKITFATKASLSLWLFTFEGVCFPLHMCTDFLHINMKFGVTVKIMKHLSKILSILHGLEHANYHTFCFSNLSLSCKMRVILQVPFLLQKCKLVDLVTLAHLTLSSCKMRERCFQLETADYEKGLRKPGSKKMKLTNQQSGNMHNLALKGSEAS